ncbi:lysophospholipid acyltransferase family protein [Sandarakinorhabdus sp.]|uniref:lysophospholipid acyltransferase family protein n=1 Tax=Sandarakinorhabdus sp. TaxID=1916663 RepID=UPI00286E33C2|nr:lysophospholipid acyltransferase family protein [Sandarakinorhabdus sp.]
MDMHAQTDTAADWPPPLPDSGGFVAPPVPGASAAVAAFVHAVVRDPAGGLRVVGRGIWLAGIAALCVPLHMGFRAAGRQSPWARRFLAWAARACGIRVRSIGTPVARDVFFIANHLSWTDALILGGQTGTAFVAQDGIAIWPGLNFLCRLNDTIFIDRSDRMGVTKQIAAMRSQFAAGERLALFPEGGCGDGRRLLPFKAPLFAMLIAPKPATQSAPVPPGAAIQPPQPQAVIQPVVIDPDDAGRNLAWVGMETGAANAWRLLARPGTWEARVHFLGAIDPAHFADRKALARETRIRIAAKLSETLGGRPIH